MIAILIAAATLATPSVVTHRIRRQPGAPSCQAVPALCMGGVRAEVTPLVESDADRPPSSKMDAYGYEARPCRIIGNMDCPKRARRQIFRLGEPIGDTLTRSFGLR
ncbi:hypothetical protein [Sphingobium aromaticiconvertens]|uniref:hypothetical protein n=1 Tax=Sphingobium aromaticiconvertens TaxID=365341 RepID=UPI0030167EAC